MACAGYPPGPRGYFGTVARALAIVALAAVLAPVGCQYPRDPDGTLNRIQGGTLRVGVSESDPWVRMRGDQPSGGVEVRLVRAFARELSAQVEWVEGSEEELVNALKEGSLDLVVAGLTSKSRWKKDVAFTRPYATSETVIGVSPGATLPDSLEGVPVFAERGSEAQALLERRTDARVVAVERLSKGPVAAPEYVLDDLRLSATRVLKKEKHVMAAPFGENAFMVRLERFLLDREEPIRRLVREEGQP